VRWRHVFALQTWGLIILIIVCAGLTYWGHYLYHVSGQWPAHACGKNTSTCTCTCSSTSTTSSRTPPC
jgi:hypothetical protein